MLPQTPSKFIVIFVIGLGVAYAPLATGQVVESTLPPGPPEAMTLSTVVYLPSVTRNYQPGYVSPFGIIMYSNVDDEAGLPQMQTAGSRRVTTLLFWSEIEALPPVGDQHSYTWTSFDAKVSNASAAGMQVFVLFTGNPPWAASCPGGPVYPQHVPNLVAFVTVLAERYDGDGSDDAPGSPVVNDWSFYAEPDNGEEWRCAAQGKGFWGNNGAGFAEMLSNIAPAIHNASPNARVMIGGIAYDWFTEEGGPFVRSFLADTLQALNGNHGGALNYIDAVAFHYYPISTARWPTIREKALEIKGIMSQNGLDHLPLLAPEVGYWSDPAAGSSEARQARFLVQMYARGLSVGIEHLSWFRVFDDGPLTEQHGLFWGSNLADPKLAYDAYRIMTGELYGASYASPLAASGVEGYVFTMSNGSEKTVLWSTVNPSTLMPFGETCLRKVETLGTEQSVVDGGSLDEDGVANGQISLEVYLDQPNYVGSCN